MTEHANTHFLWLNWCSSSKLPFFGIGMKTDLFQSCGHCWAFQIWWHIECSTLTASSFKIWNSSAGIPSPPLALFVVMLPKAHLTSHSRMSGPRWVITPSWLSGSWRSFLYSSSTIKEHYSIFLLSKNGLHIFKKIFLKTYFKIYLTALCLSCSMWNLSSSLQHLKSLDVACGIQLPDQGSNPYPLHWEGGVLATGTPGKSLDSLFLIYLIATVLPFMIHLVIYYVK